jgi:predicted DsbA family dithiol-disulfide isomerase
MTTPTVLRIDFVSDVSCPWCAIGLAALEQALGRLEGTVQADIHLQPFELNPQLSSEGEDATEHLMRKYRIDEAQVATNRAAIRERAAALGFAYNIGPGSRVYNTFDAHRLLHWAELQGRHLALKKALLRAYFTDNEDVASHDILLRLAEAAGLDRDEARQVLASDAYAADVRAQERYFQQRGIHSVPATIINGTHLVSGGQPPEVFEQALRQIATTAN